jgi:conjugal transfer mating pair stabilization protein TraN
MKGWGKNANLCRCSGGEKGLALKREKGLCHLVGTYCSRKDSVFGQCLEKKTNFCCFGSKLARIFQEQGRKQLGIDWGSANSPNCRPLTLDELKSLDFSKFDMEELFDALLSKGKGNMSKSFPHLLAEGEVPAIQREHMTVNTAEKREIKRKAAEEEERKRLAKLEKERLLRIEQENIERARLAKLESDRRERERERLLRIEQQRREQEIVRSAQLQAEAKNRRKALKEKALSDAKSSYTNLAQQRKIVGAAFYNCSNGNDGYMIPYGYPVPPEFYRISNRLSDLRTSIKKLENDIQRGNY